jgi:hypothetical protein
LAAFQSTDLDYLVIDDYLFAKPRAEINERAPTVPGYSLFQ